MTLNPADALRLRDRSANLYQVCCWITFLCRRGTEGEDAGVSCLAHFFITQLNLILFATTTQST